MVDKAPSAQGDGGGSPLTVRGSGILFAGVGALVLAVGAASLPFPSSPPAPAQSAVEPQPNPSNRVMLGTSQLANAYASGALHREVRSLLNVGGKLRHGEYKWDDNGVPAGPVWIRVDLDAQLLSVFRAGHEIGTAVILFGADEKETPRGRFAVLWKRKDHHSSTYDAPMPFTLNLTEDGVAIHGSDVRRGRATHGCIGLPLEFAGLLFQEVRTGDEVMIVSQRRNQLS